MPKNGFSAFRYYRWLVNIPKGEFPKIMSVMANDGYTVHFLVSPDRLSLLLQPGPEEVQIQEEKFLKILQVSILARCKI